MDGFGINMNRTYWIKTKGREYWRSNPLVIPV